MKLWVAKKEKRKMKKRLTIGGGRAIIYSVMVLVSASNETGL